MKSKSVKAYLSLLIAIITIVLGTLTVVVVGSCISSIYEFNYVLSQEQSLSTLTNEVNNAYMYFTSFISNPSDEIQEKYNLCISNAKQAAHEFKTEASSQDIYYAMVGVENILWEEEDMNAEIMAQLSFDSFNDIYPLLAESQTLVNYINLRLASVTTMQDNQMQTRLAAITLNLRWSVITLILFALITATALITYNIILSRKISMPILKISTQVNELANGNLNTPDIPEQGLDEFAIIAKSLNKMKSQFQKMIGKLKEQTITEAKLRETEIVNLRMANDLKNTELRVMQAQINPHFLFNTLNSISRLAMNNHDLQVVDLIEALAEMLRYNLNHIDRAITLEEELSNLKNYVYIQETRFPEKLSITIDNRSKRMNLQMPCLTLQPIVENAIMHGLKPYNYEGNVCVIVTDEENYTEVIIRDDGVGMEDAAVEKMINGTCIESSDSVRHTSIGFNNVMSRLNSYYSTTDCVQVKSIIGEGTTVTLRLLVQ